MMYGICAKTGGPIRNLDGTRLLFATGYTAEQWIREYASLITHTTYLWRTAA